MTQNTFEKKMFYLKSIKNIFIDYQSKCDFKFEISGNATINTTDFVFPE